MRRRIHRPGVRVLLDRGSLGRHAQLCASAPELLGIRGPRRGSEILVGTVYDPVLDECYSAAAGHGAFLNGVPIQPVGCQVMEQALVAASLPTEVPRNSPEVSRFIEVLHGSQAIRRLGSAALSLCYVASGRLDAYWATCVKVWDVAAGQLIVREAGGVLTHPDGTPFQLDRPQFVAAATPQLHSRLSKLLAQSVEEPRVSARCCAGGPPRRDSERAWRR